MCLRKNPFVIAFFCLGVSVFLLVQNAECWIYLDLSPDLAVLCRDVSRAGWKVGMSGSLKEQAWGADGDAPPLDCWSIDIRPELIRGPIW